GHEEDAGRVRLRESFVLGLADHGYEDRRNVLVDYRYGDDDAAKLAEHISGLVSMPVDVILAADSAAVVPAREATRSIPIVMTIHSDPIRAGLVESLRRPGGNVTGLSNLGSPLVSKRLELLRELVPKATRLAVLWHSNLPGVRNQWEEAQQAAAVFGL